MRPSVHGFSGGAGGSGTVDFAGISTAISGQTMSCAGIYTTTNALDGTTATNITQINNTPAAAGAQQVSPAHQFTGQGWKTDATAGSQAVDWRIYNSPTQGAATPTGSMPIDFRINGGSWIGNAGFKIYSATTTQMYCDNISANYWFTPGTSCQIYGAGAGNLNPGYLVNGSALTAATGNQQAWNLTSTFSPSTGNGNFHALAITPTINQNASCTGSYTALYINATETSAPGGANTLIQAMTGGVSRFALSAAGSITIAGSMNFSSGIIRGGAQTALNANNLGSSLSWTATSGNQYAWENKNTFAPTSGTAIFTGWYMNSTINQTGGANGAYKVCQANVNITAAGAATDVCRLYTGTIAGVEQWGVTAEGICNYTGTSTATSLTLADGAGTDLGANSPDGWLKIRIAGALRYMPYWNVA